MPPDINKLFRTGEFHIDELSREANISKQWLLENINNPWDHPISANHLDFFVCASNAFPKIVADIQAAEKTVDLVCWGFDPGMEIGTRQGGTWPRGLTYGDLLSQVAANGRIVRLMVWYPAGIGKQLGLMANNLPGYTNKDELQRVIRAFNDKDDPDLANYYKAFSQTPERAKHCVDWWEKAITGQMPNLHVRHRCQSADSVEQSMQGETNGYTSIEIAGLKKVPTHHQKPILIDYECPGPTSVGYVMGLNSTTDYWDTPKHIYDDPLRGYQWEGTTDTSNLNLRLKPYRDYAIRVQGPALFCLNRNFSTAWDLAKKEWDTTPSAGSLSALRARFKGDQFVPPAGSDKHISQIVRTQPEEKDKTIQDTYWLATSQARNYIYIENQYFQHTPWAEHLKAMRLKYTQGMKNAKAPLPVPALFVFILIPEPEKGGMVPRTYDTIAELGEGKSIKKYDDGVKSSREMQPKANDSFFEKFAKNLSQSDLGAQIGNRLAAGDVLDSAARAPVSAADLRALGIQVLIGKLYTQGSRGKCREIYIHSKLMIIDDAFFTLGSANLNLRSMAGDSEINIACMDKTLPRTMRQTIWGNLAGEDLNGGAGTGASIKDTHKLWIDRMTNNAVVIDKAEKNTSGIGSLKNHIVSFSDTRGGTGFGVRLAQAPATSSNTGEASA